MSTETAMTRAGLLMRAAREARGTEGFDAAILAYLDAIDAIVPGVDAVAIANATIGEGQPLPDVLARHRPTAPEPLTASRAADGTVVLTLAPDTAAALAAELRALGPDRHPAAARLGAALAEHHTPTPYQTVARADGAWRCALRLEATTAPDDLRAALERVARETLVPLAACLHPDGRLELYRDPSVRHGTPSPAEADRTARALAETTGWTGAAAEKRGADEIAAVLGLSETYTPGAPVHRPDHLQMILGERWRALPVQLLAARAVDGQVSWRDEPGVVLIGPATGLGAVVELAAAIRQHRFTVHEPGRSYALAIESGPG